MKLGPGTGVHERPLEGEGAPPDLSPEGRRRQALARSRALMRGDWQERREAGAPPRFLRNVGPGTKVFEVLRRVWTGVYRDGTIHAGNLAYMSILALFPFFITVAGIFSALGKGEDSLASIHAFLSTVPPMVAGVIEPVARDVLTSRSGWLLWIGAVFGLWTVSSLVETIRDILHRAYGTPATQAFWRYRLLSSALIVGAVVLLMLSLFAQVLISAAEQAIAAWFPALEAWAAPLATSRLVPALALFFSLYTLFLSLTPSRYRGRDYPKWPGALLVTAWWVGVSTHLPGLLRLFTDYSLTYGSLAGVMIALFFFWLVGLGMVAGAELNAALAETPEEKQALAKRAEDGSAPQDEHN